MRRITGIWIYTGDLGTFHKEKLFCPKCKIELTKCVEGCTILHFYCEKCGFRLITTDQPDLWDWLFESAYNRFLEN